MMFSFCEGVWATSGSPWHIRKLTDQGQKLGGGIDTPSLCGRVGPPKTNGWDLEVELTEHHLEHNSCKICKEIYDGQSLRKP